VAVVGTSAAGYGEWYSDLGLLCSAGEGRALNVQWFELFNLSPGGAMRFTILFLDDKGNSITGQEHHYEVRGQSEGWTGDLAGSPFVKHAESRVVPPAGARLRISLVSGGAETVTGTMMIDDLSVQVDAMRILSVQMQPDGLHLTWNSQPNMAYTVESTAELGPTTLWTPLAADIVSQGDTTGFVDELAHSRPSMFSRVLQQ
jgi:hypothetical protein